MHMRVYTSGAGGYQYHPSIRFCKLGYSLPATLEDAAGESGLVPIKDILPPELRSTIDSQIQAYRDEFDRTVKKESDKDKQRISEADLTLRRAGGRWRLMVPLQFSNWKYSHNYFVSFHQIDCPLPESLVGHNELCIPLDEIRKRIPDATDAVSSPDNWMLVVQTPDSLKVYIDPLKSIEKPVFVIPISDREKIVLNQWSHGKALAKWDEDLTGLLE